MALDASDSFRPATRNAPPPRRTVDFRSLPLERSWFVEDDTGAITHRIDIRVCPHTGLRLKGTFKVEM